MKANKAVLQQRAINNGRAINKRVLKKQAGKAAKAGVKRYV